MMNTFLPTVTNSPTTLNTQFVIPSLSFALLQSKGNLTLLNSERKNQPLCRRTQNRLLVIGQCRSSKSYQHLSIEQSSLSHHHFQP